jgi:hypothetical protein
MCKVTVSVFFDEDGVIFDKNGNFNKDAFCESFGVKPEDVVGYNAEDAEVIIKNNLRLFRNDYEE